MMPVLLASLSVLALWSALALLVFELRVMRNTLEGIRRKLEQVVSVVRAVEAQTEPLGRLGVEFANELARTVKALTALGPALDGIDRELMRLRRNDEYPA